MTTAIAFVDRNRSWLSRTLRQAWNKGCAKVNTRTWQVRPDCRLMLIDIVSLIKTADDTAWIYQLAPNASDTDLEGSVFLYERTPTFELTYYPPLETSSYWIWSEQESERVIVLCKRTLEMRDMRLPFAAISWIGNTLYQARDTLILVTEERDQRRAADQPDDMGDALDIMVEQCDHSLSQGRKKSLLPHGSDPWSYNWSAHVTPEQKHQIWLRRQNCFDINDPDLYGSESVFVVYETNIAAFLASGSRIERRNQMRCIASSIGRHELPRILLHIPGSNGMACPPCWPWSDESAAQMLFAPTREQDIPHHHSYSHQLGYRELGVGFRSQSGMSARSSTDFYPRMEDIAQTEHLMTTELFVRLRNTPDQQVRIRVIIERHTGRWLHVFSRDDNDNDNLEIYTSCAGGCLKLNDSKRQQQQQRPQDSPSPLPLPTELDLVWLEDIDTLRYQVLLDATPLPLELVDLVLDHVDGGFWRRHMAALAAATY
jgi:hypothetical protein